MDVQDFHKAEAVLNEKTIQHMNQWIAKVEQHRNLPKSDPHWYTVMAEHSMQRPRVTEEFADPALACLTMDAPEKDDKVAAHLGLDTMHREVEKEIARLSSAVVTPEWS